jgi:hypothetical protein
MNRHISLNHALSAGSVGIILAVAAFTSTHLADSILVTIPAGVFAIGLVVPLVAAVLGRD